MACLGIHNQQPTAQQEIELLHPPLLYNSSLLRLTRPIGWHHQADVASNPNLGKIRKRSTSIFINPCQGKGTHDQYQNYEWKNIWFLRAARSLRSLHCV